MFRSAWLSDRSGSACRSVRSPLCLVSLLAFPATSHALTAGPPMANSGAASRLDSFC
jgi:hypothetical protein